MGRRVGLGRLWAAFALCLAIVFTVVFTATAAPAQRLFERFSEDSVSVPAAHDTPAIQRQQSVDAQRNVSPAPVPTKKHPAALPSLQSPEFVVSQLRTLSGHQSTAPPATYRGIPTARGPPTL